MHAGASPSQPTSPLLPFDVYAEADDKFNAEEAVVCASPHAASSSVETVSTSDDDTGSEWFDDSFDEQWALQQLQPQGLLQMLQQHSGHDTPDSEDSSENGSMYADDQIAAWPGDVVARENQWPFGDPDSSSVEFSDSGSSTSTDDSDVGGTVVLGADEGLAAVAMAHAAAFASAVPARHSSTMPPAANDGDGSRGSGSSLPSDDTELGGEPCPMCPPAGSAPRLRNKSRVRPRKSNKLQSWYSLYGEPGRVPLCFLLFVSCCCFPAVRQM